MTDYVVLAKGVSRQEFIAASPAYFLYTTANLVAPRAPAKTAVFDVGTMSDLPARPAPAPQQQALVPVAKQQEAFPSMITVGRTANNDVVINDVQISKFHAYFRKTDDGLELCDAGSRNGTWVGGTPLQPKGGAARVRSGETVQFGQLTFLLLDAGAAWDRLRAA